MKTFVYIDHFKGEALPASWEAIGVGKTLRKRDRPGVRIRRRSGSKCGL